MEKQLGNCKDRSVILSGQMTELRTKLQNETTQRLESDKRIEALEDELDFNIDVHRAEIKEYEALIAKLKKQCNLQQVKESDAGNTVAALSVEYEAKLQTAIADLQRRHAEEIRMMKISTKPKGDVVDASKKRDLRMEHTDMSAKMSKYETEVANLKRKIKLLESELEDSENKRATEGENYKAEITNLRLELELMLKELQDLMDAKLSLELEISAYRKLLEGEESRIGMKSFATAIGGFQTEAESALANALAASKMTLSRSTTGVVGIIELATDGTYIKLEDVGKSSKSAPNMKNWTLTQTLDNGTINTHKFTDGNVFSSGKIVKIWGSKHGAGEDGITSSAVAQWGTMAIPSTISLKDDKGKEYSSVVIKINS
uniref:IF rod domain-containing protein n=2 Tax=Octopus bimaculoides TaxID=37653 RepID=A0A0L8GZB5_OCTBM|eukprot:XP_014776801.1 PREDICTED: 70 kDa neurofilament protein-like [Octopus bimaculoides]